MLHKKEKVKKNLKRPSDENHQKISSVRRENKYIYMYIYTHFQTVAILKKNYMAFCFLIYKLYLYMKTSIGKVKPKWNNTRTVTVVKRRLTLI